MYKSIFEDDSMLITEDLLEETGAQLMRSTWLRIRQRAKWQHIKATHMGLKSDGSLLFTTTSGTSPRMRWTCRVQFRDFSKIQELAEAHPKMQKILVIKMLLRGHIKVYCNCPCFHYYCEYVASKEGYGIRKQVIPARMRNPHNEKLICKHLVACLSFIASNTNVIYNEYLKKGYFPK